MQSLPKRVCVWTGFLCVWLCCPVHMLRLPAANSSVSPETPILARTHAFEEEQSCWLAPELHCKQSLVRISFPPHWAWEWARGGRLGSL